MTNPTRLALLSVAVLSAAGALWGRGKETPAERWRRPVALVPAEDGRRLFVANRGGSVSVVDVEKLRVLAETDVGRRLADLAAGPGGRLLAVDEAAGELLVLAPAGDAVRVTHRLAVGLSPVSVRLAGARACVACLWAHQVAVVEVPADGKPRVQKKVDLPFPPRLLLPLGGDRLLAADAFGGRLAVVDVGRGAPESVRSLPAHNLRGLALSADGKEVLVAHQVLFEESPTRADEVRWGNVITNGLRSLPLTGIQTPSADLLEGGRLQMLGDFLQGAADPAGVAVVGGRAVVALAGTGEVALEPGRESYWVRLRVGRRPTAVAAAPDGRRAFVANTFGDSVTVLDVPAGKVVGEVSLGPTPAPGPAERGEMLFFDGRLSKEGWMSCNSCHGDGHTNGRRSDTLGDGSYGAPKRVPSLLGVGDTAPYAWNGSLPDLKAQVRQSVVSTMNGPRPTEEQVADLEAFLRTLKPPPPVPAGGPAAEEAARRGRAVFAARDCARCHTPPVYTSPRTYEVGLADELGKDAFNPPSLRGVGQGLAFLHDSRAATLEEVFARYHHQVPRDLPRRDLDDLVTFLRSL
jgi:YVTN family beta-propeller protein